MKLIKELFKMNEPNLNGISSLEEELKVPEINKDIFVDNTNPKRSTQNNHVKDEDSPLQKILLKDWKVEGYNDGYKFSCKNNKEARVKSMICQIETAIEQTLQILDKHIFQLKSQLIGVVEDEDLSLIKQKIELKIEQYNKQISDLKLMQEALLRREGVLAKPIHQFIEGFIDGTNDNIEYRVLSNELNTRI